jgi:putative inorganic carbon (hco3(-)) transporter
LIQKLDTPQIIMGIQKFINCCDRAIEIGFYALIFFLPISTALIEISSTVILTSFFFKRGALFYLDLRKFQPGKQGAAGRRFWSSFLHSFQPLPTYLNWPIAIFLFINILSIFVSQFPQDSIRGFMGKWFQSAFLFFSFIECMRTKKQIQNFILIFLLSAALIVTNGLTQYVRGQEFIHKQIMRDGRVGSSFNHPNDFGGYLVVVISLLISFGLLWRKESSANKEETQTYFSPLSAKLILMLIFVAALACLGMTYSRGAWLGLFSALGFLGFHQRRLLLGVFVISIIFVNIFFPKLVFIRNVSFTSDDVRRYENTGREDIDINKPADFKTMPPAQDRIIRAIRNGFSGMGRNNFWNAALAMIRNSPILGMGVNTYHKTALEYKVDKGVYPHNCYLQIAAETGLAGLTSFLWIVVTLFVKSARNIPLLKDRFFVKVSWGYLAGLFGYLSHSFFDTNFYPVQLGSLLWIVIAVIVAIQRLEKLTGNQSDSSDDLQEI